MSTMQVPVQYNRLEDSFTIYGPEGGIEWDGQEYLFLDRYGSKHKEVKTYLNSEYNIRQFFGIDSSEDYYYGCWISTVPFTINYRSVWPSETHRETYTATEIQYHGLKVYVACENFSYNVNRFTPIYTAYPPTLIVTGTDDMINQSLAEYFGF